MSVPCSTAARAAAEPLAATAPYARGWIIIEAPGPWGRSAPIDSGLDPSVSATLAERAAGSGTTILVARRPGRTAGESPRRLWVAHTSPGGVRMRAGSITEDAELLVLDPQAIAAGESPGIGERSSVPALFVCTNAKRDACCAREGGPLARALAASEWNPAVWECSHIGGHRFAATALLLPWGTVHGRLTEESARAVLTEASEGRVALDTYRGRSSHPRWLQAAEHAVRAAHGIVGIDDLDVLRVIDHRAVPERRPSASEPPERIEAEVRSVDGRAWRVTVTAAPWAQPRAESCTGEPVEGVSWNAASVVPAEPWR